MMPSLAIENDLRVLEETVIPISEISHALPFNIAPAAVQRWLRHGVGGVKLESAVIGRRRFTSKEAIRRFLARLNGADPHGQLEVPVRPSMPQRDLKAGRQRFGLPEAGRNGAPAEREDAPHEN